MGINGLTPDEVRDLGYRWTVRLEAEAERRRNLDYAVRTRLLVARLRAVEAKAA